MVSIGIDLGTTFSCVSIYNGKSYEVIPNNHGNNITPSFVKIKKNEIIVGEDAKENFDTKDTLSNTKRLMGQNEKIKIGNKTISPEFCASEILKHLKSLAENYTGTTIKDAVITVPAYFNNAQRQATIKAGKLASLNVLRIINEPTAAALAYGIKHTDSDIILIVDCGGGTTDISILSIHKGTFIVKGTVGNNNLGGIDIDKYITDYIYKSNPSLKVTPKNTNTLKILSEKIKKYLTNNESGTFKIGNKNITITRNQLNEICKPFYNEINKLISQVLKDTKLTEQNISKVLCVGGSTRIPQIRNLLRSRFQMVLCNLNPDEVVAIGASIQAYNLTNTQTNSVTLLDTIPLSLGVKTAEGLMEPIIEKNTSKPCKRTKTFTTFKDSQKAIKVDIYEGNRPEAKDNYYLGTLDMTLQKPGPKGEPQVDIVFDVNNDGILSATAIELQTSQTQTIQINFDKALGQEAIQEMRDLAEANAEQDLKRKIYLQYKGKLEALLYSYSELLETPEKQEIMKQVNDSKSEILQELFDKYETIIYSRIAIKKL